MVVGEGGGGLEREVVKEICRVASFWEVFRILGPLIKVWFLFLFSFLLFQYFLSTMFSTVLLLIQYKYKQKTIKAPPNVT